MYTEMDYSVYAFSPYIGVLHRLFATERNLTLVKEKVKNRAEKTSKELKVIVEVYKA